MAEPDIAELERVWRALRDGASAPEGWEAQAAEAAADHPGGRTVRDERYGDGRGIAARYTELRMGGAHGLGILLQRDCVFDVPTALSSGLLDRALAHHEGQLHDLQRDDPQTVSWLVGEDRVWVSVRVDRTLVGFGDLADGAG